MKRFQLIFLIALVIAALSYSCKKSENYNETATLTTGTTERTTTTTGTSATDTSTTTTGTTATTATGAPLADKDKDFVTSAGKGGMAEVELAQDALTHATNADVKAFAQKLVDDHGKANQELTQFASSHGVTMPSEMQGKLKEAKERLLKLTGKSFDQAFVKQMIDDHTETIKEFEEQSKNGADKDLKKWVDDTLPKLREHLSAAKELQTKIGKK